MNLKIKRLLVWICAYNIEHLFAQLSAESSSLVPLNDCPRGSLTQGQIRRWEPDTRGPRPRHSPFSMLRSSFELREFVQCCQLTVFCWDEDIEVKIGNCCKNFFQQDLDRLQHPDWEELPIDELWYLNGSQSFVLLGKVRWRGRLLRNDGILWASKGDEFGINISAPCKLINYSIIPRQQLRQIIRQENGELVIVLIVALVLVVGFVMWLKNWKVDI